MRCVISHYDNIHCDDARHRFSKLSVLFVRILLTRSSTDVCTA